VFLSCCTRIPGCLLWLYPEKQWYTKDYSTEQKCSALMRAPKDTFRLTCFRVKKEYTACDLL